MKLKRRCVFAWYTLSNGLVDHLMEENKTDIDLVNYNDMFIVTITGTCAATSNADTVCYHRKTSACVCVCVCVCMCG